MSNQVQIQIEGKLVTIVQSEPVHGMSQSQCRHKVEVYVDSDCSDGEPIQLLDGLDLIDVLSDLENEGHSGWTPIYQHPNSTDTLVVSDRIVIR